MNVLSARHRKIVLTALVAAISAVVGEHLIKPYAKGKLKV